MVKQAILDLKKHYAVPVYVISTKPMMKSWFEQYFIFIF